MNQRRVVIIGGGPGGYVAAIRAAQLGAQVTLIERDKIGGTCLNRGCIPTKALLHDAKMLRLLRSSNVFQPLFSEGFSPLESMMERKKKVVQEMVKGVEMLLESHRITVKRAEADLLRPLQIILSYSDGKKETVEADAIILAPGSESKTLPHIVPDGNRIITSDEALEIKKIPHEVVIIGGGYIGVEFAAVFNALGSKVTIVEILDNILAGLEDELVRNLRRFLERDGVRILTKSKVEDLHSAEERLSLTVNTPRGIEEIAAEKLLLAVGRGPSLGLDFLKVSVEVSSAGIRVNHRMETTAPNVYAVGDAIGGTLLAHVAMEEGIVAAENAMGVAHEKENHIIPLCIFTYPEVASAGLTEKEAKGKGAIKIGRFPFRSNPTALISGETDGLVKVIAGRDDDKILGVHIIGHDASTLISVATSLMEQNVKAKEFPRLIQAHPTTPEALKEAFLDVEGLAIHLLKPLRTKA
ncbi:MAG: dihydrolipoyl dehydrogenase [Thermodesulfobacteriota bacterium]